MRWVKEINKRTGIFSAKWVNKTAANLQPYLAGNLLGMPARKDSGPGMHLIGPVQPY